MKTIQTAILVCIVAVGGQQIKDSTFQNEDINTEQRQKRWNSYNDQYSYESRIDSNGQEYLPRIVRLLEEINTNVKKPQQQSVPHPIYVPYPIPYPFSGVRYSPTATNFPRTTTNYPWPSTGYPQRPTSYPQSGTRYPQPGTNYPQSVINNSRPAIEVQTAKVPTIGSRNPEIDNNRIWGSVNRNSVDDNDGARPISFEPIKPGRSLKRPVPKVERHSIQVQSKVPLTVNQASSPENSRPPSTAQSPCTAAILACCGNEKRQQKNCFYSFQCGLPYDNGNACKSDSIRAALAAYQSKY